MTDNFAQSPLKSPEKNSAGERNLPENDIKDIINKSFSKFNFHLQRLNDKYKIKMEDLSKNKIIKALKFIVLDKRIEELDFYVNQYFEEENNQFASPKKP